jgi:hypothetical protein
MKTMKNAAKYSLYILLPLFFFGVTYLMFAYATWEIDPSKWDDTLRVFSLFVGVPFSGSGILLTKEIILEIEK